MPGNRAVAVIFDGSFDGMLCIAAHIMQHDDLVVQSISASGNGPRPLCDSLTISTEISVARQVQHALKKNLTERQRRRILYACLADDGGVYLPLLHYIRIGVRDPGRLGDITDEHVRVVIGAARRVARERHRMLGFTRFVRLRDDSYMSVIEPRHDVLPLLGGHFRERFPDRRWYMYDRRRRTLLIHAGRELRMEKVASLSLPGPHPEEKRYQHLWRTFFDSVAIGERVSYKRQRSFVPLFYRGCMTEFAGGAPTADI